MGGGVARTALAADIALDFRDLRAIESGNANYYSLRSDPAGPYLHGEYAPGASATKQALVLPSADRRGHYRLSWRWRALTLPVGGNECDPAKTDSAGSVYVAWRRGLKWYGLKYSWTTLTPVGAICDGRDNPFLRGETIILHSGGPLNVWQTENIDVDAEYRAHFAHGDPKAEVPDLMGIAVLTDGDQTGSPASADFGNFVLHGLP